MVSIIALYEDHNAEYLLCVVSASVVLTRYRTKLRRQMNERDVVSTLTFLNVVAYISHTQYRSLGEFILIASSTTRP